MMGSAEVVFGKTGILMQLPGLCDPELAIILPFLENIKSFNKIETRHLNKMTFPSKWKYVRISTPPSVWGEKKSYKEPIQYQN